MQHGMHLKPLYKLLRLNKIVHLCVPDFILQLQWPFPRIREKSWIGGALAEHSSGSCCDVDQNTDVVCTIKFNMSKIRKCVDL